MARHKDPEKVNSIFKATLDIASSSGKGDFTMADVAKKADIAAGTIYLYFENKEDLLNKLFLHLSEILFDANYKSISESDNFFSTFRTFWYNHFNFCIEKPAVCNYLENYGNNEFLTDQTRSAANNLAQRFLKQLQSAQTQFLIKNITPEIILTSLLSSSLSITRYIRSNNIRPTERELEDYFEMAWNSIRR
jgi:AcrR family transcriptional regulator